MHNIDISYWSVVFDYVGFSFLLVSVVFTSDWFHHYRGLAAN